MRKNPEKTSADTLKPNVAGQFYPADPSVLSSDIQKYLEDANISPASKRVLAIMVPHAGYVFSAPVAAYSFRHVQNQHVDTVLFIALAHRGTEGGAVYNGHYFETPLGKIPVDTEIVSQLIEAGTPLHASTSPYLSEHSVEVNLPFVQTVFPKAKVASILITQTDPPLCRKIGQIVADVIRKNTNKSVLICVSSDMSHYPPYDDANRIDQAALQSMESLDPEMILKNIQKLERESVPNLHCVLCGSAAMLTAVEAARELGAKEAKTLCYRNSGDSPYGDHQRVVGYGAFAIYAPQEEQNAKKQSIQENSSVSDDLFSDEEQKTLLFIARKSIDAALNKYNYIPAASDERLHVERGVFVTLKNHSELRGCLGRFDAAGTPLYKLIATMATESATHDFRFNPVNALELPEIDIQISVLSPLQKVTNIQEIEIGKHGLQIRGTSREGSHRLGTLLPQVASERGWNVEQFLDATCVKAGLEPDAWKQVETEIMKYSAEVFGDLDYGSPPFLIEE